MRFNQIKVWQSSKVDWSTQVFGEIKTKDWIWWKYDVGLKACQRYYDELKAKSKYNTELQNAFKTVVPGVVGRGQTRGTSRGYISEHLSNFQKLHTKANLFQKSL